MRNTSKPSPRDEVANRNEKFMAAESRESPDEVGRKHARPFALSLVSHSSSSRVSCLDMLKGANDDEAVQVPICLTQSEVQEVFNHINQKDEFPVEFERPDINKPVRETK